MTKTSRIPKSKAKNAYELLSEVRALILAEPKRYDQSRFIKRLNGAGGAAFLSPDQAPSCGTVGCVAGWVATLKKGKTFSYLDTRSVATRILGLENEDTERLFSVTRSFLGIEEGTKPYAQIGAQHIRAFQKKYAKQLKGKRV